MKIRLCGASLLAACALTIGFLPASTTADNAKLQCLDNQLLRVNSAGTAWARSTALKPHHQNPPLESRLTCISASRAERSA